MSTSPAVLSRRALLRGAASVTVVAALAAVPSCADGSAPDADVADGAAGGSDLLRLGHVIAGDAATSGGTAPVPPGTPPATITSDTAAVAAIDARSRAVQEDFATGRSVVTAGWLLSATEADVLVAYAGACPLPAC